MPRVLVAPDAFKGTFPASEVAAAIARGARGAGAEVEECPVADGGEGTIDVLLDPLGGELRSAPSHDPLGRPIEAGWAWIESSSCALIEMARASGLALVAPGERDAERASSAGSGELLLAARDAGARRAVLAIGGTATSDGGAGALAVIAERGGLGAMSVELACDVDVPFEEAAVVFGPQKGASPEAVERLTARLHETAERLPRDPRGIAMTGAGGGLAGALWAVHGARLRSGASLVLDALEFEHRLCGADAVIVGEGRLDAQTRRGKIVGAILARSGATPVHAVVGSLGEHAAEGEWDQLASIHLASSPAEMERVGSEIVASLAARL